MQHLLNILRAPTRAHGVKTLASAALLLCASAQAQGVYKCHIDGRLVFQSSPCAPEPHAAVSLASQAGDAPAPPKKKTLADLLRERDAADRSPAPSREFKRDGAEVLRTRMGAV